jgi:hypothetical protein
VEENILAPLLAPGKANFHRLWYVPTKVSGLTTVSQHGADRSYAPEGGGRVALTSVGGDRPTEVS